MTAGQQSLAQATQKMPPTSVGGGQSEASAILAALASMGKQNTSTATTATPAMGAQDNSRFMSNPQTMAQTHIAPPIVGQPSSFPAYALPVNAPAAPVNPMLQMPGMANAMLSQNLQPANPINPLAAFAAQAPQGVPGAPDTLALQLQLLQSLASGQVPQEQMATVLAALGISQAAPVNQMAAPQFQNMNGEMQSRDRDGRYGAHDTSRYRDRSLSPDSRYRRGTPPHRRDSPTYGTYDPSTSASGNGGNNAFNQDRRGRGRGRNYRNDYRQRSPLSAERGRQPSPGAAGRNTRPKWIDFDPTLPPGSIKGKHCISHRPLAQANTRIVLSRTLFVGGATYVPPLCYGVWI